jgi:colanic acid/amylovoran biosynthesis glycosyltransferase
MSKPLVASICGTFLKPEMQSVYRQIIGLRRHRTVVLTERRVHADQFPFEPVIQMERPPAVVRTKLRKQRQRGNFIRRFYYKHLLKTWPPPAKAVPSTPPAPAVYDEPYNLVDLLRRHRPALAHVYYGHKAVKYLPMLRRWGGPLIVSFHGFDVTSAAYQAGDAATLPEVFTHARLILGRSQSLLDRLAELGCPPEKLRLNRTSIPLASRTSPATIRTTPPHGRWIFLQACRLIPKKGLPNTLRALREIVAIHPNARLILAGSGPLDDELRRATAELGLSAHVEFAGWCSQERLADLYAQAHIFLHPSEITTSGDQEGVPNAMLEAMASGLPVVATRHGGIPEAVTDGVDGLLVSEKSPDQLAGAILRICMEDGLVGRLSAAAATNIARQFSPERQISALEDCYEEACAQTQ